MSGPMEPVIEEIHSKKTNVPGPWGIPWQSHQMKIVKQKHTKQAQHLTQLPCKKEITFLESCRVGKKNLHDIL